MFRGMNRKCKIEIVRSFDGSIPRELVDHNEYCGISLDFDMYPLLNLPIGLHDADDYIRDEIINETIIIKKHFNKFQSIK